MRDSARIKEVLNLLEIYWTRNPDLRLGQILGNFSKHDSYYFEDSSLIKRLKLELALKES